MRHWASVAKKASAVLSRMAATVALAWASRRCGADGFFEVVFQRFEFFTDLNVGGHVDGCADEAEDFFAGADAPQFPVDVVVASVRPAD
jgi:hypothetical protein